jgi:hypothetical protein
MNNNPLSKLTASQLHQAAAIKDKIDALQKDLSQILSGTASKAKRAIPKRKRAKADATKKAAKAKASKKQAKPKKTMSPAARKKLSQAAKARWAKAKRQGKKKL